VCVHSARVVGGVKVGKEEVVADRNGAGDVKFICVRGAIIRMVVVYADANDGAAEGDCESTEAGLIHPLGGPAVPWGGSSRPFVS
jgi:hypothetical protein